MPLVRARCRACMLPLGDPPPSTLDVTCNRCARVGSVRVAADGQPVDFDPAFSASRLAAWLASARVAMGSGTLGLALGACAGCGSPLVVSSHEAVSLPCPHCGETVRGLAAERLIDQWTEPWAKIEGGGLELEYRLAVVEDGTAGCAVCGTATPAGDPSMMCARCGSAAWAEGAGGRMQLGVRIDGIRDKRPFQGVVSIVQGEALLRADALRGRKGRSGSSLLGATGIGCASAIAVVVLLALGIAIALHFAHC
jgi:hypothetical protein